MLSNQFKFKSKIWLYPGMAAWHFVNVPKSQSATIKKLFGDMKRGWGSLPVLASIGKTNWKTSIFPDSKTGTYLLALKAEVRKMESLSVGKVTNVLIEIQV
jgi:hypothetical protein